MEDPQLVDAVLADYESAPIDDRLRETLRFLETMTLEPDKLDASRALAAGVSRSALRDAADVAAAFGVIIRFADMLGAEPHSARGLTREQAMAHEGRFFELGYA
jgi:alkylhydroperoxidase family enzyme